MNINTVMRRGLRRFRWPARIFGPATSTRRDVATGEVYVWVWDANYQRYLEVPLRTSTKAVSHG